MKEIVVEISPSGEIIIKTKGFRGKGCQEASKFLEKLGQVESDVKTSEYYENESLPIHQEVKNGGN